MPDILQFAPANVISLEDCQQDWDFIEEQHICFRDPNAEQGICGVSGFKKTLEFFRIKFYIFYKIHRILFLVIFIMKITKNYILQIYKFCLFYFK